MKPDINETALVPYLIAEKACYDEGVQPNDLLVNYLTGRAEKHYQNNLLFRQQINNPKNDCRNTLQSFMQHWLKAIINKTGAFAE